MDKWKSVMLDGKVRSKKTALALIMEHGDQATARAAALMREARKRRMSARALHWSRVAMWIEELKLKKEPAVKRAPQAPQSRLVPLQGRMETRAVH
jgi:hypothetical protein